MDTGLLDSVSSPDFIIMGYDKVLLEKLHVAVVSLLLGARLKHSKTFSPTGDGFSKMWFPGQLWIPFCSPRPLLQSSPLLLQPLSHSSLKRIQNFYMAPSSSLAQPPNPLLSKDRDSSTSERVRLPPS